MLTLADGWLCEARRVLSPNSDKRPDAQDISLLVIHNISLPPAQFGGNSIEQFFLNQLNPDDHPYFKTMAHLKVSAHMLITREGELVQFVNFNRRAWHAGVSCFQARTACNDFSIGIELEGADHIPYSDAQYRQLAALTQVMMQAYPAITPQTIVGHSDIAPGRKTDPGPAFQWPYFFALLSSVTI
ncbi:MAG: 1,6-anhydro-N-acetylmuramyl-L-alanine amidase AmpD [Cellvibrionaceae bacterium]|nr:1,6-anhydro-N-acetylmuramyl-L-alanine amidase AmpD [Cellvibrionaceae bacterium]